MICPCPCLIKTHHILAFGPGLPRVHLHVSRCIGFLPVHHPWGSPRSVLTCICLSQGFVGKTGPSVVKTTVKIIMDENSSTSQVNTGMLSIIVGSLFEIQKCIYSK